MDSGNSGSLQSSSGADEEYDSRADSLTAAFLTIPPTSFAGNFHPPPPQSSSSAAMFDHNLSSFFDPRSSLSNQNPLLNLDNMAWSRSVRSDSIPSDLTNPPPNFSSISNFSNLQNYAQSPDQPELLNIPNNCSSTSGVGGGTNMVRNSKKRPRASRRAPTTVLTTDTTNFRAMVQEFTGIPAPPFTASSSSSSPFTRHAARFDLFTRSAANLDIVPSTQGYLSRPFPQKPSFLSPSPPSTFLPGGNLQNPIFDIHNMFQSNPKLVNSSNDQNLKMGVFEEFGLGHGLAPASEALQSTTRDNINITNNINNNNNNNHPLGSWAGGRGGESNQQGGNLRSSNGNINGKFLRYGSGTVNSSGFLGDKSTENLRARSEGMVEPWICSSD